jgi:hypothetical protein
MEMVWISCNERLPAAGRPVLVVIAKSFANEFPQTCEGILVSSKKEWRCSDSDVYLSLNRVTHWMPLPEPPDA